MTDTWIVVADASRARIFETDIPAGGLREKPLQERTVLTHPESRLHEGDLSTGGKGGDIHRLGKSSHETEPATTVMENEAEHFAVEIAGVLRDGRHKGAFEHLMLVAEPKILGRLREKMDSATRQTLFRTVDKNWAQQDQASLESLLDEHIRGNPKS